MLPVSLTGSQVRQAFGQPGVSEAKLSKLRGINPDRPSQIKFDLIDLAAHENDIVLHAGKCYVVYVTREPDVKNGATGAPVNDAYTFKTKSTSSGLETVTYDSPIYHINGVARGSELSSVTVEESYNTAAGTLKFIGYYYRPAAGAPANSYIVTGGKMYHLASAWTSLMGTMWTLEDADATGEAKTYTMLIDDGTETTAIEGIFTGDGSFTERAPQGIYTLQGQKLSSTAPSALPKGIYIINGKKVLVR